jgi:Flagellar transcriptional activator (FlhC)
MAASTSASKRIVVGILSGFNLSAADWVSTAHSATHRWQPDLNTAPTKKSRPCAGICDSNLTYLMLAQNLKTVDQQPLLSITRAWRLVKFVNNNMLGRTQCCKCGGHFVTDAYENARHFECGLCTPPARAGKGAAAGGILLH